MTMTTLDESASNPPSAAAAPKTSLPAGWYDDPQELHAQRFYDGATWTHHVTHFGPKPCTGCHHG